MHHYYKKGYLVTPQLKKISDGEIFESVTPEELVFFQQEKVKANETQKCFVEEWMTDKIYKEVIAFIKRLHSVDLSDCNTFSEVAMKVPEDLVIYRHDEKRDWLAAGHICFPSSWWPEEKVGRNFSEIHEPVPGMNLKISDNLVKMMTDKGPFERFVWSMVYNDSINFHPTKPHPEFDSENPQVFIKVERQVVCSFSKINAALFTIRQHLIKEDDLDKEALIKTLSEMNDAQLNYKSINKREEIIDYLKG